MGINNKIYELRKKAGMSQEELGFKLNVTRQTVSKWETGQSLPEIDKVNTLCDLFEISTDDLLRDQPIECKKTNEHDDSEKIENKRKNISFLTLTVFTFFLTILLIPIMNELNISKNIEAVIVGLGILFSAYFLVSYLKNRKK
ncbi:helix-turn-helix domain-containing protein [Anaerorhabdus furcosa]|uniref:DNA-binding transcriptional regulator, XRE-family HTH domain n=1 Tax=Anaerorhabdus furcosa TaxID=118967 RepID=A0A1T4LLS2_9FIRM|nr:helix-turn-helix transcriptional regulator [Anaerorhabdus furcosa]SJZ55689.1 DNA-binding transcriptional regulator, XRE-family HTH domain [Anaerorhabdus furcosa]